MSGEGLFVAENTQLTIQEVLTTVPLNVGQNTAFYKTGDGGKYSHFIPHTMG